MGVPCTEGNEDMTVMFSTEMNGTMKYPYSAKSLSAFNSSVQPMIWVPAGYFLTMFS